MQALRWGAFALLLATAPVAAKPLAFAKGKTLMLELGGGTMNEAQFFYAPRYWASVGAGWIEFENLDGSRHQFEYLRGNLLVHRWNLAGAQANVFAWGTIGIAAGAGFQADYETRRVYASFKSDLLEARGVSHRTDTLQLGWAPYAHDYDTPATWIVVQGRTYTGGVHEGVEEALLLRFFKGGTWVEVGATTDRKLQVMLMFNF